MASFIFSRKPESFFTSSSPHEAPGVLIPLTMTVVLYFLAFLMLRRIRNIAQRELDQVIEWQDRVKVLDEVSSITRITRTLLVGPLNSFRDELQTLGRKEEKPQIDRMQNLLEELLLISQSFAWIYRAHGGAGSYSVLSSRLMRQLEVLLTSKAEEQGWTFEAEHRGSPIEVFGPIPKIVLFLFTLSAEILKEPQPSDKLHLTLEFDSREKQVTWKLRWPYALGYQSPRDLQQGELSSEGSDRQEMIRDLSQACAARIHYSREQGFQEILISLPAGDAA